MIEAQYWQRVGHKDPRAVAMADRHYSRRTPGSPEFTRPGHKIVLLHLLDDGTPAALWASARPAPDSGVTRADGLNAWDCTIFRVEEHTVKASALIHEAVQITASIWAERPAHGFVTTIDPRHVTPIKRRGVDIYGYCYLCAGWQFLKITSRRKLHMLQLAPDRLAALEPISWTWARPLFGNVTKRIYYPPRQIEEAAHEQTALGIEEQPCD
jgi:hypothetical protein